MTRVWHVGRAGDIAGGMTQVVNAFVAWPFENTSQEVIVSRDGSRGLRAVGHFLRALWQILTMRSRKANVIAVHLSQRGSFLREGLLLVAARWCGHPTVAHLHGSSFVQFANQWPNLVSSVLRRAHRVLVLSEETDLAVSQFVPASRVTRLPNAVAAGRGVQKEPMIVFGGGVTRRKGVDVLLSAWDLVGPESGWSLVIAGPLLEPDLVSQTTTDVEFLGALPHAELMALLERSSVAILPSRDEAMPMFLLEAMGRDNCLISTDVGGIPALLQGGCGEMVSAGDVDGLASAMRRVMYDERWRAQLADAAKARFLATFAAEAVYPQVEAVWLSAVAVCRDEGKAR